jgi:hypothetical protein
MTSPHPLVKQLYFTRTEFQRTFRGLSEEDASRRIEPMNCISWNVGHLAWQEQRYFLSMGQGQLPFREIDRLFASGAPSSTPSLKEMLGGMDGHHTGCRSLAGIFDTRKIADVFHT